MRNIIIFGLIVFAALIMPLGVMATTTEHNVDSISGGGLRDWGLGQANYRFYARVNQAGEVEGYIKSLNRNNCSEFHADLNYLSVEGNTAWLGGTITRSDNKEVVGSSIFWQVQDNGKGENAKAPDRVSMLYIGLQLPDQMNEPTAQLFNWDKGVVNIKQ